MSDASVGKSVDILLVEDNPGDVFLTQTALADAKISNNLHVVMDGEEAIAFLFKQGQYVDAPRPDVILLDLNLPKKDGREVLQDIKNNPHLKRIPVVVLTTSTADEDILRSYNLHANCYISKPLNLDRFAQVVQSIENFWFTIVMLPPK